VLQGKSGVVLKVERRLENQEESFSCENTVFGVGEIGTIGEKIAYLGKIELRRL